MKKIAWLVDTAAGFTKEEQDKYPIYVVPMGVILNGEHYQDQVDLTTDEFYKLLRKYGEGAKTTQPNFQSMLETYEQIKADGYDAVIGVHPSSELTGSYQNSVAASQEVDIEAIVIDSRTGAFPYKKMVLDGIEAIENGQTFEEAAELVKNMTADSVLYLLPKSMQQMIKSGRVSASQGFLAGLFNIQIILELTGGKVIPLEKIRTKKKVFERLVQMVTERINESQVKEIAVLHAGDKEEADKFVERIKQEVAGITIKQEPLVPVAGVHTGYGTVGIGWIDTKK